MDQQRGLQSVAARTRCLALAIFWLMNALILSGCVTPTQIWLDAEVDRLCAKDGGVKVYEKVYLPADRFDNDNLLKYYKPKSGEKYSLENLYGPNYKLEIERKYIYGGASAELYDVTLTRINIRIFRRYDKSLLGETVQYSRAGGDIAWWFGFFGDVMKWLDSNFNL